MLAIRAEKLTVGSGAECKGQESIISVKWRSKAGYWSKINGVSEMGDAVPDSTWERGFVS